MIQTFPKQSFSPTVPQSVFTIPHGLADASGTGVAPDTVIVSIYEGNNNSAGQSCALGIGWVYDATNITITVNDGLQIYPGQTIGFACHAVKF